MIPRILSAVSLLACTYVSAQLLVVNQAVSEREVLQAQDGWCKALLAIGAAHATQGQASAKVLAEQVIDSAYGYGSGAVLFKPTLTTNPQTFRVTKAGALAYFVGGDAAYPNDTGFALKGWRQCRAENSAIYLTGNTALSMGKVHFTGADGKVTSVDKTWGYVKDASGALRIVLHHSSLEYSGQ